MMAGLHAVEVGDWRTAKMVGFEGPCVVTGVAKNVMKDHPSGPQRFVTIQAISGRKFNTYARCLGRRLSKKQQRKAQRERLACRANRAWTRMVAALDDDRDVLEADELTKLQRLLELLSELDEFDVSAPKVN